MKKIILVVVVIIIVALLGRLGWAFWQVQQDEANSKTAAPSDTVACGTDD